VRYLSVCSGIEAATEAWHELGWLPEAFSEIEPFPCAVLKHHYPEVPNLGDMTKFKEWNIGPIDLLVGGTPCQSFSVAGLREGLADPRGDLMLTFLAIARRHRPRWLVWENVPGVLSSNGGEDFACLLRGLAELGYGWSYRVLDAQHFGVAQRRRRVFVVGYLGDWHPAAAVLLERSSLSGHPAPSREKREGATPSPVPGVANCLTNRMHKGINTTVDEGQTPIIELPEVMCTLRSSGAGFDRPGNASTEHETYIPTELSFSTVKKLR
jgi:DNA (cytosine-5)-methyltransferase 1